MASTAERTPGEFVRRLAVTIVMGILSGYALAAQTDAPTEDTVWVEPGTVVWDRPGAHGREVARVQTVAELPVTETTSGWVRVVYLDRSGWIERPEVGSDEGRSESPCDQLVIEARMRCVDLDWVWLLTDLEADQSGAVERLLAELPTRYRLRYGDFQTQGGAKAWFAVLRQRSDYDAFLDQVRRQMAVDATAVASGRVAAMLFEVDATPVDAILTHEGVHLINRSALGEGVPVWLEEGAAGCLGLLADDGSVAGDTAFKPILVYHPSGWSEEQTTISHAGSRAAVARLRQKTSSGELAFEPVLSAGRRRFYDSPGRQQNYELSSLLTCYLAERVFPPSTGGLVAAWRETRIDTSLDDDWLPADLGVWADELLRPLEEAEEDAGER